MSANAISHENGFSSIKLLKALMALAAFHLVVSLSMYAIANSSFLASYHNGQGLWNFAMDSFSYHKSGLESCRTLMDEGFTAWWNEKTIRHTKWIALTYYIFGPHPVSFAPLGALAWAANIILIYLIASHVCEKNSRAPIISALLYGFMPSALLSATQLMRDPFYNLGVLMIALGWVALLSGNTKYIFAFLIASGLVFCEYIRPEPFWLLTAVSVLAAAIIAVSRRKALPHALLALMLITAFYTLPSLPSFAAEAEKSDGKVDGVKNEISAILGNAYANGLDDEVSKWFANPRFSRWSFDTKRKKLLGLVEEHGKNLERFLTKWNTPWAYSALIPDKIEDKVVLASGYRDAFLVWYLIPNSSLIDSGVMFRSPGDIIRYTPRAFQAGFFSLFPRYWFTPGATGGDIIRFIGGAETLAFYFLYAGFLVFLATAPAPRAVKIWLLLFMLVMVIPLGYFVPNIGTLFRMRYVYLAPALIGGVWGLGHIAGRVAARRNAFSDPNGAA